METLLWYYTQHPERKTPESINNFHLRLPGGWYRSIQPTDPQPTLYEEILASANGRPIKEQPIYRLTSKRRLSETEQQVFASIDAALAARGYDLQEIERRNSAIPLLRGEEREEELRAMRRIAAKIFPDLIRAGYWAYDLER